MAWRFVLTDLSGTEISELPGVSGRTAAMPIRSVATGGYQLRLDRSEADAVVECETLLKVYEDVADPARAGLTRPRLHAHLQQVTGAEKGAADGGTVTATYADPAWDLQRRLCGKIPGPGAVLAPGALPGYAAGSALAPIDRGEIIRDLINATAAEAPLRLRMGTVVPSSSTYVRDWVYKPILEAITELSATLDGPDWRVRPIEYDNGIIGELDVMPAIGGRRPEAIFEFGDGKRNVSDYERVVTREGQANQIYHLPPGFPDPNAGVVIHGRDAAAIAKWGLLESVVSSDLAVNQLRQQMLDQQIRVRGNPRQTISFTPGSSLTNAPRLGDPDGYDVGDTVQFRAYVHRAGRSIPRVAGWFRAYQAAVSVSDVGVAATSITVSPDGGS